MVVEWLLQALEAVGRFIVGLFDFIPAPPAFFSDLAGHVDVVASYMAGTGVWLPWGLMLSVLALWGASLFAAVTVRFVRIVASFMTGGGGGAA